LAVEAVSFSFISIWAISLMPCLFVVYRHVPGDPSVPGSPPTQADWDIIADHIVTIDRRPELYAQFFKHTNALNEAPEREKVRRRHFIRGEFLFLFVLLLFARTDVLFNTARGRLPKRAVSAD
jgi:hypothetical protein